METEAERCVFSDTFSASPIISMIMNKVGKMQHENTSCGHQGCSFQTKTSLLFSTIFAHVAQGQIL